MRDRAWAVLTRHFFSALFDFGFLSDAGAESFKRLLLGAVAVAMGLGLLLVRVFMVKYANLADGSVDAYASAVVADHAFLIAVPMWIVAAAVTLVGHALFPDETDYRVLMAEPVARTTVFGAKLAALLLFAGLFMIGTHAALLPLLLVTMIGPVGRDGLLLSVPAFALSSLAASAFAALAVVALHGMLILGAPRSRLLTVAIVVRSMLLCALVLVLPLLMRLPGATRAFASGAWWLPWAPPAWFVGLERWLLGEVGRAPLAFQAMAMVSIALAVAVGSYLVLYRRFDRVVLRPVASSTPRRVRTRARAASHVVRRAVTAFTSITLRRSVLHQGIVVALVTAAAGLVINSLLGGGAARVWRRTEDLRHGAPWVLTWAPAVLMFIAVPAVRLALMVPLDLRANWIFRMTEDWTTRADAIASGVRTVFALGVALPVLLVAPLQWMAIGVPTGRLVALELLVGWLLVEVLMQQWRRIPFTCSYLPGKGFVPQMFVKGTGAFILFTTFISGALQLCLVLPTAAPIVGGIVLVPAIALAIRRRRLAPYVDFAFEDELPTEVNPLRLNAD